MMSRATKNEVRKQPYIIVATSQKGGVGKTTAAVHLAFGLKECGKNVLLVDADTQGNASSILSRDAAINTKAGGAELLFQQNIKNLLGTKTSSGIDLLHGHVGLEALDKTFDLTKSGDVKDYLQSLPYDFIVFDTPPAIGVRQVAPMIWADLLLIPLEPSPLSTSGLASTMRVIKRLIESGQNSKLNWKILVNRYKSSSKLQSQIIQDVSAKFPEKLLKVTMPERVSVSTCLAQGLPIWKMKGVSSEVSSPWKNLPQSLNLV